MPMVWDERYTLLNLYCDFAKYDCRSTQYSLCIAIVTMILWFVRLCIRGRTLDICGAVVSNILYDALLIALWSYSAVIQSSGDFLDPKHIAFRPWYLERECTEAWPSSRARCRAAKGSYALAIFAAYVLYPLLDGASRVKALTLFSLWFGTRCITVCMYGAYMYGKSSENPDFVNVDVEKCVQLSTECS